MSNIVITRRIWYVKLPIISFNFFSIFILHFQGFPYWGIEGIGAESSH